MPNSDVQPLFEAFSEIQGRKPIFLLKKSTEGCRRRKAAKLPDLFDRIRRFRQQAIAFFINFFRDIACQRNAGLFLEQMRDIIFAEMEPFADLRERNDALAFGNHSKNPRQHASSIPIA